MSEPTSDTGARPTPDQPKKDRDFRGVLKALKGKTVSVVNPESYEAAPMGFQLKEGYYSGKVAGLQRDFLVFDTSVTTSKKEGGKIPVRQYIPIARVKRISMMKDSFILHL
jgi:hypothetical protein